MSGWLGGNFSVGKKSKTDLDGRVLTRVPYKSLYVLQTTNSPPGRRPRVEIDQNTDLSYKNECMGALRQIKVGKIRNFVDTILIGHKPLP